MYYRNSISTVCIALLGLLAYFNRYTRFFVILPSCAILLAVCWIPTKYLEQVIDRAFAAYFAFEGWKKKRAERRIVQLWQVARAECAVAYVAPFMLRGSVERRAVFCAYDVTDVCNYHLERGSLSFNRIGDSLASENISGELRTVHILLRPPFKGYSILMQEETTEVAIDSRTHFEVQ